MKNIINRGINCAPAVGLSGVFYPGMFVHTPGEWDEKNEAVAKSCAERNAQENQNGTWNGYWCPLYEKGGFVYLYEVDERGDWNSVAFTHSAIAEHSKYPYARCCGSCKHCSKTGRGRECKNPASGYKYVAYTDTCAQWEDGHERATAAGGTETP